MISLWRKLHNSPSQLFLALFRSESVEVRLKITFFAFLLSLSSYAASTVLLVDASYQYITISQNYVDPWSYDDEICVMRGEKEIACGFVKFAEPESAIVKIDRFSPKIDKKVEKSSEKTQIELVLGQERPLENDTVVLKTKNPIIGIKKTLKEIANSNPFNVRTLSSLEENPEEDPQVKLEKMKRLKEKIYWDDSVNPVSAISLGLDYAWPFIEYTQSVAAHVTMTLRAVKMNYPVGYGFLDGLGGYLTYNYFPFRPLRGLWFQSGMGLYMLNVSRGKLSASTWSPGLISTVGYKVIWNETLSFGFAGGLEYLPLVNGGNVKLDFGGFLPSFLLNVGYFF